jgi:hypothetical protein
LRFVPAFAVTVPVIDGSDVTEPIFHVPLCVAATVPLTGCVACQNVPVTGTVPGSTDNFPPTSAAGSCAEIAASEEFPVVCNALVAAPVASGIVESVTESGTMLAMP